MEWGGSGRVEYAEFQNRTKVCEWMAYAVGDLRKSLGHGEVWIGVPVRCYMECNTRTTQSGTEKQSSVIDRMLRL